MSGKAERAGRQLTRCCCDSRYPGQIDEKSDRYGRLQADQETSSKIWHGGTDKRYRKNGVNPTALLIPG